MTLSIIMPVFNASETVARAVGSVAALADRLDGQVRLLAVDDCSTDATRDVLQALCEKHSFLELHRMSQNTGPGPARNYALDRISGGWVGFIDADDEIIADGYAKCLRQGDEAGADFITFNGHFVNGEEISTKYDFSRILDDRDKMIRRSLRSELDGSVIFSIFRKTLIEEHHLRFGEHFYEDIAFAHLGLIFANKRLILDEPGYKKFWLGSSIVNTVSVRHIRGLLTAIVHVRTRLEQSGYYDTALDHEFAYGAHGYIARAVIDVVKSTRHSSAEKRSLLDTIAEEFDRSPALRAMPMLTRTRKDRICTGLRRIMGREGIGEAGLAGLTRLVDDKG